MSADLVDFLHELGHLKRVPRSGWALAGVPRPESVAEHSWRTAALAFLLASEEGADPYRAAGLALFHDLAETRTGDPHHLTRRYQDSRAAEDAAAADQRAALPAPLRDALAAAWEELREQATAEARLVKDADRLECLLQAREYARSGHDTQEWQDTARERLRDGAARRWAERILAGDPDRWWRRPSPAEQ